jgi:hypothetical protein
MHHDGDGDRTGTGGTSPVDRFGLIVGAVFG